MKIEIKHANGGIDLKRGIQFKIKNNRWGKNKRDNPRLLQREYVKKMKEHGANPYKWIKTAIQHGFEGDDFIKDRFTVLITIEPKS